MVNQFMKEFAIHVMGGGADSPVFLGLIYFVFVVLSYILLLVFIIAVQM